MRRIIGRPRFSPFYAAITQRTGKFRTEPPVAPVSETLKENRDAFVSFRYPTLSTTGPDWLALGRAHNVLMKAVDDPAFRQLCPKTTHQ